MSKGADNDDTRSSSDMDEGEDDEDKENGDDGFMAFPSSGDEGR